MEAESRRESEVAFVIKSQRANIKTRNETKPTWPEFKIEESERSMSCDEVSSTYRALWSAFGDLVDGDVPFSTIAYHFNAPFIKFGRNSLTFINFNLHLFVPRFNIAF